MTEREETIQYLVQWVGISREEAELRMVDDELWILGPSGRYEFPAGEDSVKEWDRAVDALEGLYWASQAFENRAFMQAISDAHKRAKEALRRARKRAQEASAQ